MTVQTCPKCGGQEFGKGKQNAYGHMYPVGRISLIGTVCQIA